MPHANTTRAATALQQASAAHQRGQWNKAAELCQQAIDLQPDRLESHLQLARHLQPGERLAEAVEVLANASNLWPQEPNVYLQLGNLLAASQNWPAAQLCFAACCQLQPNNAVAQHNWGVALLEQDNTQEAIAAFERAIGLNPAYAAAYYALGLSYQRLDAHDAALLAFDCAAGVDPQDARYPIERARTLISLGRFADALAGLEDMASAFPAHAEGLNLQGIALKGLHRGQDALSAYDQAIQARPGFAEALNNRGNLRLLTRRFSSALDDFNALHALKPGIDWLAGTRLYTALHVYDWQDVDRQRAAILDGLAQRRRCVQPLALQCMVDDPQAHQQAARIWTSHTCRAVVDKVPRPSQAGPGTAKIKVAYVSRDFKSHPVSFLMAEVFELHDRTQFDVIAINYGAASNDAMQARLRAGFDQFLDVEGLSDRAIAELCRSLAVDIAIDLTGFTDGARSDIFHWRAAPVQMLYLGYLGTSGSSAYDYLIADPVLIPEQARQFYDEKVVFLPSYQANDRQRPRPALSADRASLGLPPESFVYCCFNNPCKISPASFAAWAEILRQVPNAVLWLLDEDEHAADHLRQHMQRAGLSPQRIVLAKRTSRETYLANQGAADLFLDTLPYNAGTTASDALWMGLPVLTQLGQSFAGRMAASLLQAAGLPELITTSVDDYIRTAVRLARQPEELAALKQRLHRNRLLCPLFDAPQFTRHLELALQDIHRRHLVGETSQDVVVGATLTTPSLDGQASPTPQGRCALADDHLLNERFAHQA